MRQTNVLFLLAAGVATAALQKLQPGSGTSPAGAGALLARQFNSCSSRDTCHDCFGDGYVICDTIGCFNPEIHQQCCKDALLCVGRTNNCCGDWGGPGETGTSGVPNVTARPLPTGTPDEGSFFECRRGDEGEECCQRGNPPLHSCFGEFPNFRCYDAANQWCCTEGTVCDEEDCCELFNAEATHPSGGTITPAPSSTGSSTGSNTGKATDAPTSPADGAEGAQQSTTTSTAGANPTQGPGLVVIGLAALGLGLL